jgi:hypothetical protein
LDERLDAPSEHTTRSSARLLAEKGRTYKQAKTPQKIQNFRSDPEKAGARRPSQSRQETKDVTAQGSTKG